MMLPYELRRKRWEMETRIKEELRNPNFLDMYTRKPLREVMVVLYPHVTIENRVGRAFMGRFKVRMYKHLKGYAILKCWK